LRWLNLMPGGQPSSPDGRIAEVTYVKNQLLFPISWLNKQDFCEYQIYLENVKGIKVKPTTAMTAGKQVHQDLFQQFIEKAVPATVEEMLAESLKARILSREFRVVDLKHGVYGYIDEVWMTPDSFIVIDDKPGAKAFRSNIHQIYGYCLAFREIVRSGDERRIMAALRERGTDHIYWQAPFDRSSEEEIVAVVERIHALLQGKENYIPSGNPNKCRSCRLNGVCEHNCGGTAV
jgi:CRISPR-associated exonuclease Cas4